VIEQSEIVRQAKALLKEKRKEILISFTEKDLHKHLKSLLNKMDPSAIVEITHGPEEYGKDIVMVREDKFGKTTIGIVVKVGDIRGKTSGEVDKIKSQVEQAFAHSARLKAFVEDLPVSEVWIMMAGELSRNAHKRLKRELKSRNIRIFDINWLISNFTDYYPQVFFEGKLMDFIQEKIQELETKHMFSQRGKNLSECFVEPLVATIEIPVKFDEDSLALIIPKQKMPFLRLKSVLSSHRKIILAGDPGTGKSVALAKLSIDMLRKASTLVIRGESKQQIEMPILVPVSKFETFDDCETLIKKYIPSEIRDRFKISVLMVDGLDEVRPEHREEVLKRAEKFATQLNCSLIVTTRKVDIIKTSLPGFEKYEFLSFEFGRALKLFEKLVSDRQILNALKDGLEKIKFQISITPLSLMLLIELAENYKEIPASIAELYDRFSDIVLGRFDKEKGIEILFEYLIKKRFLSELAFKEFLEKKRLEIPREEFEVFLTGYAERYGWDKENLRQFISEIERAGILDFKKKVAFRHRSFLDYFTAFYIYDKREEIENLDEFIMQIYFEDIWADTAFFYIGLKRDISNSMLEKMFVFEKEGLSAYVDKFLIGRLLQAAWHSPTKTKSYGIERAVAFASLIREKFLKIGEKSGVKIPRIFADFLIMVLSDLSFGSGFLLKEVKNLFNALSNQPSQDNLYKMLSLLWAIQRFLTLGELREAINNFSEALSKISKISIEEKTKALLFLKIIARNDKTIVKMIKRKIDKLRTKYPDTFRELLPRKKKGFR